MATYPLLDIQEFGKHLLATGDLDPIYIALHRMKTQGLISQPQLCRWLVGYWCFYSAGVASHLSEFEGPSFWARMAVAVENVHPAPPGGRWERGKERRHFRGAQGRNSLADLQARYPVRPESMVDELAENEEDGPLPFSVVSERAREITGFGPWISFKIGDMLERVLGHPIDFSRAEVFMFKDPREAAFMLHRKWSEDPGHSSRGLTDEEDIIRDVVRRLQETFRHDMAPPEKDRVVGLQELETILCKWKSHVNGHYPLDNDIHEITRGTQAWVGHCPTAEKFLSCMPQKGAGDD